MPGCDASRCRPHCGTGASRDSLHERSGVVKMRPMPTIPEALQVAVQHHQAGRLQAAEHIYRQILTFEPEHPDTLHLMGVILAQSGRAAEAAEHIQRAIRHQSDFAPFYCSLGNVLQSLEQWDDAIANYERAIQLQPNAVEAHNNLGNALQKRGRLDAAVASYQRAIQYSPDYFEAHCNLGQAHKSRGDYGQAVAHYQHALRLNPNYGPGHNDLGTVLQLFGDMESAVTSYRHALRLNPDHLDVYSNLGFLLIGLERTGEAAEVWQEYLRRQPENVVARHMVAATTGKSVPARSADDYLRKVFDDFAPTFDQKLGNLEYRGPELVATAITNAIGPPQGDLEILDAGCGTGLGAPALRSYARQLTGLDISTGMLEQARQRGLYDELIAEELTAHLETVTRHYDLIAATDTFIYFGELRPVFAAVSRSLKTGGWLFFTLEKDASSDQPYRLQSHGRFCHSEQYVRESLIASGLSVQAATVIVLRREAGKPVPEIVVSARKK